VQRQFRTILARKIFWYRKNNAKAYKLHVSMISIIGMSLSTAQTFYFTWCETTVNNAAIASDIVIIIKPAIKLPFSLA